MKNITFITAGAGSGKTYTLTTKLAEKIKNNGLKPDQIILTTFTKAAAEEFKQKAAKELMIVGKASEAQQLAGAMIGTIDSVAQAFVQKYWYLLGLSPELNVMGDGERKFYEVNSLTDSGVVSQDDLNFFDKVRKTFNIQKKQNVFYVDNPDFWQSDLRKIIELSRNYAIPGFQQTIQKSNDLIDSLFDKDGEIDWNFVLGFPKSDGANRYKFNKTTSTLDKDPITAKKEKDTILPIATTGKTFATIKKACDVSSLIEGNGQTIEGDDLTGKRDGSIVYPKSWVNYVDTCKIYIQSKTWGNLLKEYVKRICDIATKWNTEYENYKQSHHLMDFNDIELKFKELLGKQQVQDEIKARYKLVMVDEFQDCNPLQVEIFDKLSDLVAETIWVGDKKQSIYGFRGSDMDFINAVISKFPDVGAGKDSNGLQSESLQYSFRSRKRLVEMANEIFKPVFAPEPSVALIPKREVNNGDDLDDAIGQTPVAVAYDWHSNSSKKEDYYADLASQIKAVLDGKAKPEQVVGEYGYDDNGNYDVNQRKVKQVTTGDIAVLCRKGFDVNNMAEALAKLGVRVNAVEHDIKDFGEIQLLMAMLNYSLHRNDFNKAQILYLWENKTVSEILGDKLATPKVDWNGKDWKNQGFVSIDVLENLDTVLDESKGQTVFQLVETLLLRLDVWNHVAKWGNIAHRHANINTFLRIVATYEEHCRLLDLACSVMGFINYFNSEEVSADTPFIKDPEAVSVLTYHKSKGLEWPIVILDCLYEETLEEQNLLKKELFGVQHYAQNTTEITCAARQEYLTICPSLVSGNSNLPSVLVEKNKTEIASGGKIFDRVKAENARLLYVGFTRARDYVITTSYDKKSYEWLSEQGVHDDTNVWNSKETVEKIEIPKPTVSGGINNNTYNQYVMPQFNVSDSNAERYINPSQLGKDDVDTSNIAISRPTEISNPIQMTINDPMNDIGTCIHNVYAVYDGNLTEQGVQQIFKQHGLDKYAQYAKQILDAVGNLFEYLKNNYGQASQIFHELPVLCQLDNKQIMRGEIDLLWMLNDNEAIIVDYKSKKADENDDATDDALKKKAEGYARQLRAYKTAVEKNNIIVKAMVLFFPLQGKVVVLK